MLYKTTLSWKHFIQIDELQTQVWQDTCRTEVWTSSPSPSFVKFDTWLLNTSETKPETVHRKKAWFVSVGAFVRLFVVRFGFHKFVLFTTFDTLEPLICVVSTYLYVFSSTDLWEISQQNKLIWADLFAPFKVLGT